MTEQIETRQLEPGDINFIYSTMLKALYYHKGSIYGPIEAEYFFERHHYVIESILRAPNTVRIACLKSQPEVVLGYAIAQAPTTLHFAYIKKAWRGQGLARLLVASILGTVACCTHVVAQMEPFRLKKQIKYNPYLLKEMT